MHITPSERTDTSGRIPDALFGVLYQPTKWQTLANHQMYTILVEILTAGRAHGFTDPYILPKHLVGSPLEFTSSLSYSTQAIAGADGALSNGVPLRRVFRDLVATTRDRTPTCTPSILPTFRHHGIDRSFSRCPVVHIVRNFPFSHSFVDVGF